MPTDDRFLQALQGAARAWRLALDRHLKAHGLTAAGWNALAAVADSAEPPSQRELARRLGVDGATLVTTLDRLAGSGFVRRDSEPGDRRVKRIGLTPDGGALTRQVRAEYWVGNRSVKVETQDATAMGTLMRLHSGNGVSAFWVLLADTLAGGMVLLSVTGLLLWSRLHPMRLSTVALSLGSLVATVGYLLLAA